MTIDPLELALVEAGVFLIAFLRGAFGGGFAILGIPLLSLALDPLVAGALLAPLFVATDLVALRYWKPTTWSKSDLLILVPALPLGIGLGYLLLEQLDRHAVAVLIGCVTLAFAGLWFFGGAKVGARPLSKPAASLAGFASGVTTMVAHAGGPPLALYLLPRGLPKAVYAGTTSLFFSIGNLIKVWPWLLLVGPGSVPWVLMLLALPAVPLGVWAGWRLHQRLDQQRLYRVCYGLLVATAFKLLWDGLAG